MIYILWIQQITECLIPELHTKLKNLTEYHYVQILVKIYVNLMPFFHAPIKQ